MPDNPPSNIVHLPGRPVKTLTPAAVASSTRWLTAWTPSEPVPSEARDQLPLLVASAESALAPADIQGFAVAMDTLVQWLERFGVVAFFEDAAQRKSQIADIVRGYREALADLPSDVLMRAVADTTRSHRYRNLPLPADIRAHAETELRERQNRLLRLKTAAQIAGRVAGQKSGWPEMRQRSEAEIAAAADMLRAVQGVAVEPATDGAADVVRKSDDADDRREAIRRVVSGGLRRVPKPWERAQP